MNYDIDSPTDMAQLCLDARDALDDETMWCQRALIKKKPDHLDSPTEVEAFIKTHLKLPVCARGQLIRLSSMGHANAVGDTVLAQRLAAVGVSPLVRHNFTDLCNAFHSHPSQSFLLTTINDRLGREAAQEALDDAAGWYKGLA